MNYKASTPEIRAAYRRRFRLRTAISIAWLIYIGVVLWSGLVSSAAIGSYLLLGGAVAIVATLVVWQCPACNRMLGRALFYDRCPHCGVAFTEHAV